MKYRVKFVEDEYIGHWEVQVKRRWRWLTIGMGVNYGRCVELLYSLHPDAKDMYMTGTILSGCVTGTIVSGCVTWSKEQRNTGVLAGLLRGEI